MASSMADKPVHLLPYASAAGVVCVVAGTWAISPLWSDVEGALDLVRIGLGAVGIVGGTPLALWPWLVRAGVVADPGKPWAERLGRLAAEHGQTVQTDPEIGVWFDTIHGGPRFRVLLQPAEGRMRLTSRQASRHGLVVLRRGEPLPPERSHWVQITGGAQWTLFAEVRISVVGLLENARLVQALERFFEFPGAQQVSFDPTGLTLELSLPSPDRTEAVVRRAMDAAWAVWGAAHG